MYSDASPSMVNSAVGRRRLVADGPGDLNPSWLESEGRVAVPVESGRHLEPEECESLATALRNSGIRELVAVVNDPLIVDDSAYELEATADDLNRFADEMSGINVLLLPREGVDFAILFCTDDFHIVGGSRGLVEDCVGDLQLAKLDFEQFAADAFEDLQDVLTKAAQYAAWIDTQTPGS